MRKKEPAMNYPTALDEYYGGVHGLTKQSIPFKYKCGGTTYKMKDMYEGEIAMPVMHVEDTFKHIRSIHKERIKRSKTV